MATNTTATTQTHNGTGSQANFAISFSFLADSEVDVTVGGVLKTLGTHYTISGSTVTFTSGNIPPSGTGNIKFTRDTNISTKKVDFTDGSVLTETDLDTNADQILFAQQEITDKVNGIEEGATADQTDEEIRTAVGNASDSNIFTDALKSKLDAIEANATQDQTASEIRTLVESASDSNVFTDADHTKLNNIEANATADQTNAEIKTAYEANSDTNAFTDAEKTKLSGIATGAEVNVQSDFNATSGDAVILNKPTIPSALNDLSDVNTTGVANGKILKYDSSTSKFIIADDNNTGGGGGGGSSTFVGLSDTPVAFSGSGGKTVKVNAAGNALEFVTVSTDVVDDTTPVLGGNLDVRSSEITTSITNGNVRLTPNGTGVVEVKGDGSSADGTIQLNCSQNSHGVKIKSPPHSANASYTLTLPNDDGSNGQALKTDGSGVLSFGNVVTSTNEVISLFDQTSPIPVQRLIANTEGVTVQGTAAAVSKLMFRDRTTANFLKFKPVDTLSATVEFTLPSADGSSGQFLKTNGSGVLSFADGGGAATGGGTDQAFFEGDQNVTTSYQISADKNAMAISPTIASGAVITVPSGAILVIL